MFKLAWRNLMHERTRLIISIGGVASLSYSFWLWLVFLPGQKNMPWLTSKTNQPPSGLCKKVWKNLHMSSSILPAEAVAQAKRVDGVAEAVGLLYSGGSIDVGDTQVASYIFAVDSSAPFGGPWRLVAGTADLALDEVVIDRDLAARYDLALGDPVNIIGYDLTIAGLSAETFGIATSITFVNKQALATVMGVSVQAASYVLIQLEPEANVNQVADDLRAAIPEANLLTQAEFIASDKEMIRQMGMDIIRAMSGVAYIVGLFVIALTIYTATIERAHEYGVLKAIGANTGDLLRVVFAQAYISTSIGFLVGIALSYGVAALVERLFPEILILIVPSLWLQQIPVLIVITALAALLPIGRISRLDPMVVFRA